MEVLPAVVGGGVTGNAFLAAFLVTWRPARESCRASADSGAASAVLSAVNPGTSPVRRAAITPPLDFRRGSGTAAAVLKAISCSVMRTCG